MIDESLFCSDNMFKKSAWRNTASDAVSFHQDQALNTTVYLLKSCGPTGFLLKEDGEARNYKVSNGVIHNTCYHTAGKCSVSRVQQVFLLFRCVWVTHTPALALCSPRSRSHVNTSAGMITVFCIQNDVFCTTWNSSSKLLSPKYLKYRIHVMW